jgi:hypothetical protein
MAEQLGFDQLRGNGAAVDRNHRPVASGARLVDGAGKQLLAGAGFTLDQDGDRPERDAPGAPDDALHDRALVEDGVEGRGRGRKAGGEPRQLRVRTTAGGPE